MVAVGVAGALAGRERLRRRRRRRRCRRRARLGSSARREAIRPYVEAQCGLCHIPDNPDPEFRNRATHIFDLWRPDWPATLSDDQLDAALENVVEAGASDDEVKAFERFIAAELTWRDRTGEVPVDVRQRRRIGQ